jgi:serine phosphatase RsbU (regulator of sigma subunit)
LYVLKPFIGISIVFSLIVIFTKSIFYSNYLVYYQIIAFLVILYTLYFLVIILLKRRQGNIIIAIGMFTLTLTATNDILNATLIIETIDLMPIGSFVFIFCQTLILSKNLAYIFRQVESISKTLQDNNQDLENRVKERAIGLRDANEELAQNLEELKSNIEIVNAQNKEIKTKNRNIKQSINYARTIQHNILPDFSIIQKHFPESFLIFKPKDVVSGDFYYFKQKKDKMILAAVDCTGHGVPGAFMSVIAHSILNQIIDYHHIAEPSYILKQLHLEIKNFLKHEISMGRDGMDIGLVIIDLKKQELSFAGAKSPLVYVKNGQMQMINGSNFYIGTNSTKEVEFEQTNISFSLVKDSISFYLFSDGYQDQFGGEDNKKLMKTHFRELIFQVHSLPIPDQEKKLREWYELWKGNTSQTDDITLLGVKVV